MSFGTCGFESHPGYLVRRSRENANVRSQAEVREVLDLLEAGLNPCEVARRTGIPRSTVRHWRDGDRRAGAGLPACETCGHPVHRPEALPAEHYAYLLGLYLGDGHISAFPRGVFRLTIYLDRKYEGIVASCESAMEAVIGRRPNRARKPGCYGVNCYSRRWPCLLPQHGAGPKHLRPIVLEPWQQRIVDDHPEALLRGLIHSDGCRGMNTVVVRGKRYAYPRYTFTNTSADIRRIFTDACDAIGVAWRQMNATNVSVARRASVARLDEFIGPKR